MKTNLNIDKERVAQVTKKINDSREPDNDWQALLKALISQIQDDFIRLQHPSRRDQTYLKEAFLSTIAALWDVDYTFTEFKNEKGEDMTFRQIMAQRFGLEELSKDEIHKINLGPLQDECINEAKQYWLDKMLKVVTVPDFLIFDGRAFSVWRHEEETKVDYENMIIYLEDNLEDREMNEIFISKTMEIAAYYRDIKIKEDVLLDFSKAWYDILRMNGCFRER